MTAEILRTAREVADDLATDAIARDQAGKPPADEVARLREAGLLAALTPPGPGHGLDWQTACAAIREIATADSSVGEILARHYVHTWSSRFYATSPRSAAIDADSARGQWLWSGSVRPIAADESAPTLTLATGDGRQVLDGSCWVDTAATVADQLVVDAVSAATGDILVIRLPRSHRGMTGEPAHDRLGQRVADAGTLVLDRIPVSPEQILGPRPHDDETTPPRTALAEPALRLALCHVGLGIIEGALAEARDLSRNSLTTRLPGNDPDLLLAYGDLAASAQTAGALVERATHAMSRALSAGPYVDVEEPTAVTFHVATAESVTADAMLHITTGVLELADAPGLDRFWRNARVLTAEHASARRLRAIGDHYLNS
ncbi:acyl-CoA dehydrogenase family protein [Streptomyces boninensis]|uniref:acyl-CoA dehydrogenase family protein n=1 Tax=Streptomyces boninensis TaxID=2039455 RepID=UPI003B21A87C